MPTQEPTSPAPKPRTSWPRRVVAFILELGLLALLVCWLLGRTIGDRALWSQYLEWIPTEVVVLVGVLVVLVGLVLRWRLRRLPCVVVGALLVWLLFAEWHIPRLIFSGESDGEIRVVFLNISPQGKSASLQPVFDANADIVVFSNVHPQPVTFEKIHGLPPVDLMERSIGIVPGESPPSETHMLRYGMFHVYSKFPIRRRAAVHLGAQKTWIEGDIQGGGGILMVEIDTPGVPMVLWAVDMPRTLGASRRRLFEQAAERIAETTRVFEVNDIGRWAMIDVSAEDGRDPILTPDIVIGDFNTPSHAWSVDQLAPGLRPASADAGVGPRGTFPLDIPLFEIDFARLGSRFAASRLDRLICEECRHAGVLIDLDPK